LPVLFKQQEIPEADITIKVTGYQWYWGYEYVDGKDHAYMPITVKVVSQDTYDAWLVEAKEINGV